MASQISQAIKQICDEKNIPYDSVIETIATALAAAYRKDFGNKSQNIQVEFDPEKYDGMTQGIRVFDVKAVVEDMEFPEGFIPEVPDEPVRSFGRRDAAPPVPTDAVEDEEPKFNPKTMIMLRDARDIKPDAKIDEEIRVELSIPAAFGRMAAQTAKQVVMQKLREAERSVIFEDFKGREGELMNVTVQRREGRIVLIDLGRATGILLPEDQIESERYYPGTRFKALLREVTMTPKGPEIRLSRSHPDLVFALFAQEIPEVANGIVVVKGIAREAGSRTKVSVTTNDDAIDPIGSCIGQRGTRIQAVIRELGGEKVDVISWSEDPATFIANALSPATVLRTDIDDGAHLARVSVTADQLSLAIGKGGQNVRLAAKLTNWKITIAGEEGTVIADSDVGEITAEEKAETPLPEGEAPTDASLPAEAGPLAEAEASAADAVTTPEEGADVSEKPKKKVSRKKKTKEKEASAEDVGTVLDEHGERAERSDEADANNEAASDADAETSAVVEE